MDRDVEKLCSPEVAAIRWSDTGNTSPRIGALSVFFRVLSTYISLLRRTYVTLAESA